MLCTLQSGSTRSMPTKLQVPEEMNTLSKPLSPSAMGRLTTAEPVSWVQGSTTSQSKPTVSAISFLKLPTTVPGALSLPKMPVG